MGNPMARHLLARGYKVALTGEGGAGLFSDGKLYSQIKDPRFLGRQVMREFVRAGAPPEIMYVNKPHIGTFRLTGVVARLREEIIALGGEIRFERKVVDLLLDSAADGRKQIEGVVLENGETIESRHVILALGHSSRDTLRMLERRAVFGRLAGDPRVAQGHQVDRQIAEEALQLDQLVRRTGGDEELPARGAHARASVARWNSISSAMPARQSSPSSRRPAPMTR